MSEPIKIYLDTTIPNVAITKETSDRPRVTKLLLKEIVKGKFTAYISAVVAGEIEKTKDSTQREKLLAAIGKIKHEFIDITPAMKTLAQEFVRHKVIPAKFENDALHLAAATIAFVPTIVTWNLKHMANIRSIDAVNRINVSLGYPQLRIFTPYELVGHLLDRA